MVLISVSIWSSAVTNTCCFHLNTSFLHRDLANLKIKMDVTEISDTEMEDAKPKTASSSMSAADRLAAKKRSRAQKRLSTMKNKVMRNAQWASLKKEKRKVFKIFPCIFLLTPKANDFFFLLVLFLRSRRIYRSSVKKNLKS